MPEGAAASPPRHETEPIPVVRVAVRPVEVRLAVVRVHVADVRVAVHGLFSAAPGNYHARKHGAKRVILQADARGVDDISICW